MDRKSDIDAELGRLETLLPGLVAELPAEDVLKAFAREAERLNARVPAEHEAYVARRINCLLASAGLVPGETEGEPCPAGGEDSPLAGAPADEERER
ncbi:hypothetical protein [Pseudoxanthomonas sp. 10H]|uniref:hypothetical protein n=1 Tax=Pseudoxanthomonas sp. 10H TaxID=3242729 RepID=UPI003556D869